MFFTVPHVGDVTGAGCAPTGILLR